MLRDLEISLRTNHIEWVKEFLDQENQGLDALIDYLSFRLSMMRHEQRILEAKNDSDEVLNAGNLQNGTNNNESKGTNGMNSSTQMNGNRPGLGDLMDSPSLKRRSRHIAKLNMGATTDDIHVCIMCLRAIMNNKYGFNMVIQHREAINCIALSLIHNSLRTKALVLELLAAICLVKGGHEIILSSFDNFKEICQETKRFQTLMEYFMNYEAFNKDFMVACMQFVNIVVHSVEDMNYRVHLQYEFTSLGLDEYLEKLRFTESEELHVQISAYLDNVFDVAALMEDSETKTAALERVQELEEDLGRANDRTLEMEKEFLSKLAEFESEINLLKLERDELLMNKRKADEEVSTLRRVVKQNELELKNRDTMLKKHRESIGSEICDSKKLSDGDETITVMAPPPPPPPMPVAAPPPPVPPPPPMMNAGNIPKPPPPMLGNGTFLAPIAGSMPAPGDAMTIRRRVQTKYKLPTLNWIPLKPNQVNFPFIKLFINVINFNLHTMI